MSANKTPATPAHRLRQLGREVPETLASFSRQARAGLARLEQQLADGGHHPKQLTKQLVRTLREVSHQVGRFEAYGERGWRALTLQARHEAAKALRKLEKAIDPPKPKQKATRKPRKTTTSPATRTRKAS